MRVCLAVLDDATCAQCQSTLPLAEFGRRQRDHAWNGRPAVCGRCSPAFLTPEQKAEVKRKQVATISDQWGLRCLAPEARSNSNYSISYIKSLLFLVKVVVVCQLKLRNVAIKPSECRPDETKKRCLRFDR